MRKRWVVILLGALVVLGALGWWQGRRLYASGRADPRMATISRRPYERAVRCQGTLQPLQRQGVYPRVQGRVTELVEEGARVAKDSQLFALDPRYHADLLTSQEALVRRIKADWERDRQNAIKELRRAVFETERYQLRVDLEALKLKDLKDAPTEADEVAAQTNCRNAGEILKARKEELTILTDLAGGGFVSQEEVRQKALQVAEQEVAVTAADVAYRRLHEPDPVVLAEQDKKVHEEGRNLHYWQAQVERRKADQVRDEARFQARLRREEKRRAELADNLNNKLRHTAPVPGVVLFVKGGRRYGGIGLGREVWEGREVINVSDTRRMKAVVLLDEARSALVAKDQKARIWPVDATVPPGERRSLPATVVSVSEQGRDEFDDFLEVTRDRTGKADRQVFETAVALDEERESLRPGTRVDVEIVVERLEQALVVPRAAVFREGPQPYIWSQGPQGTLRRDVKVVAEDEFFCAVDGPGLADGERVWLVAP